MLASQRANRRTKRSVEAAFFAAQTTDHLAEGILRRFKDDEFEEAIRFSESVVQADTFRLMRQVLSHVRAVDLPEALRIDALANIELAIWGIESVIKSAQNCSAEQSVEALMRRREKLAPLIRDIEIEDVMLARPWWRKGLSLIKAWEAHDRARCRRALAALDLKQAEVRPDA